MNCLIVVPSLIRAGAETQSIELANGLAGQGHSIHLCSFEVQLDQIGRISSNVQHHHVRRNSKYDLSLINRLSALIDRENVDIVQGTMQFAALVACLASRRSRRRPPVVAAIHTTINRDLKEELLDRLVYRWMLQRLPAIVFVCQHQSDYWIRRYPSLKSRSIVVRNGVAPERFRRDQFDDSARRLRTSLGIGEDALVFAAIAAFRPEKGHKIMIDAFAQVRGDAFLVFAGDGDLRSTIESYAEVAGLSDRTRFLGNIPDTRPLIASSVATILASTAVETFSMAMLESMAMGVPMIAPLIGGLPEAIVHGKNGLLFPIGDVKALTQHIQFLLEHPRNAASLGLAAREKVLADLTVEKMVADNEHLLRRVISSERAMTNAEK